MKRRGDVPTRGEVVESINGQRRDMEEKETDLDKIAEDVETVRRTLEKLDFGGTFEGAEQIEKSIESAEDVTVDEFETEDRNLEEIQTETQEYENGLDDRRETSEADLSKISDASAAIEMQSTIDELERSKDAALRDIEFLAQQMERAHQARKESNAIQDRLKSRVYTGRTRS